MWIGICVDLDEAEGFLQYPLLRYSTLNAVDGK